MGAARDSFRIAIVTSAGLLSGCQSCGKSNVLDDASADAHAHANANAWSSVLVARTLDSIRFERMSDDGLIVRSGNVLYAATPGKGSMERIGAPADYVFFLSESKDDEIGGYGGSVATARKISGTSTNPVVEKLFGGGNSKVTPTRFVLWNGSAWTKTNAEAAPSNQSAVAIRQPFNEQDAGVWTKDLPTGYSWNERKELKDAVVWIGQRAGAGDETAIQFKGETAAVVVPFLTDTQARHCWLLNAADERFYLACRIAQEGGVEDGVMRIFRLDVDKRRWVDVALNDIGTGTRIDQLVVDAEGGVWVAYANGLARLPPNGGGPTQRFKDLVETFSLPTVPSYQASGHMAAQGRYWTTITIAPPPPASEVPVAVDVEEIYARRSGDVWVIFRSPQTRAQNVVRFSSAVGDGGAAPPPTPLTIPSGTDVQNEIVNARGVRKRDGKPLPCASLFVPFPSAAPAMTEEVKAAIAKLEQDVLVTVVEGTLQNARVVGAVLLAKSKSSDAAADNGTMDSAATALASLVHTDPSQITCAVPTLERIVPR